MNQYFVFVCAEYFGAAADLEFRIGSVWRGKSFNCNTRKPMVCNSVDRTILTRQQILNLGLREYGETKSLRNYWFVNSGPNGFGGATDFMFRIGSVWRGEIIY